MSFAKPSIPTRRAAVPLAPMIDILFLLLIFFVTTSTFRAAEQQVDVKLPVAQTGQTTEPTRTEVVINIRNDGEIVVGGRVYTLNELHGMLGELVRQYPDERVIIRGDKQVVYERIIGVMDAARAVGVRGIYFATVRKADEIQP